MLYVKNKKHNIQLNMRGQGRGKYSNVLLLHGIWEQGKIVHFKEGMHDEWDRAAIRAGVREGKR